MIEAIHISKHFGKTKALNDVSFSIRKGEIVSLMGANGAGKSTLFDILVTLDDTFEGEGYLMGMNIRTQQKEIRQHIGYVPGRFSLYNDLSVKENLAFFASVYGGSIETVNKLCPLLWDSLRTFSKLRTGFLSGGMKQKLSVCCALVHSPSILFLDEPTTGIDIPSRQDLWTSLAYMKEQGMTILASTHYPDEAQKADRIMFIHQGVLYPHINYPQSGNSLEDIFIHHILTQEEKQP